MTLRQLRFDQSGSVTCVYPLERAFALTDGALTELFNEIRHIRDVEVSDEELSTANRAVVAAFALSIERPARLLNFALMRKRYALPDNC